MDIAQRQLRRTEIQQRYSLAKDEVGRLVGPHDLKSHVIHRVYGEELLFCADKAGSNRTENRRVTCTSDALCTTFPCRHEPCTGSEESIIDGAT